MKVSRHPYVSLRCPYTSESIFAKEARNRSGRWMWLYRGREYDTLDDILEARGKKFKGEVDYDQ